MKRSRDIMSAVSIGWIANGISESTETKIGKTVCWEQGRTGFHYEEEGQTF